MPQVKLKLIMFLLLKSINKVNHLFMYSVHFLILQFEYQNNLFKFRCDINVFYFII